MNFRETASVVAEPKRANETDSIIAFLESRLASKQPVGQYEDESVLIKDLEEVGIHVSAWVAAAAVEEFLQKKAAANDKKVVLDNNKSKTKASEGPSSPKVLKDQAAPVLSSTVEADRKVIKRVEEDGQGVKRTEEIIEETGPLGFSDDEPAQEEKEEPAAEEQTEETPSEEQSSSSDPYNSRSEEEKEEVLSSVSAEERLLAAMALAKLAVSLGIIDSEDDMTFISGLEGETMEQIQARRDTLEMVKSAGLSKQKKSVASRVPSMLLTAPSDVMKEEDVPLEAAFIF